MTRIEAAARAIREADAVLVGACNGLSISEGIHLLADNQALEETFGDMRRRFGLRCLLQGMMARWPSEELKWEFWSRLAARWCLGYSASPVMRDLRALVGERPYFVLTTNGEGHFQSAGFDAGRVWEIEGSWLAMQCAGPCHEKIYPSRELLARMASEGVSEGLVPRCPRCGGPMSPHMQVDGSFIPSSDQEARYLDFVKRWRGSKLAILELGVGRRNQLVKAPLMRLAAEEPGARYVAVNLGELWIPDEIAERSFGLDGRLEEVLSRLREA